MKVAATIIPVLVILIFGTACSKEEPISSSEKAAAVRKTIEMPARQDSVDATVPQESEPVPAAETEPVEISAVPQIEEKRQEKGSEGVREIENGYYIAQKGESLSSIAAKKDSYADELKWSIIYYLNKDQLDDIEKDENFPEKEIPEGIRLKIVTPDEAKENLKKMPKNYWVINVMSSPEKERIVPHIVKLIMNGYRAYITRTEVDGKDWMRLRVGFFKDKDKAEEEGKKVMDILNFPEIWTTKVGDIELGEFGGY